jgi:hypothetical protein
MAISRRAQRLLRRAVFAVTLPVFSCLLALSAFTARSSAQTTGSSQQPAAPATSAAKPPAAKPSASKPAPVPQVKAEAHAGQKTFSSEEEAAHALYDAARNNDENAIVAILGPDSHDVVMWNDDPAERKAEYDFFTEKFKQMHRYVKEPDGETTLYVGAENWPLPFPLIQKGGAWFFDVDDGKQELEYRRIGENEMTTIDVCRALVDAEKEYLAMSAPPNGAHVFAGKFDSSSGRHDGLYWPNDNVAMRSPIGPFLARAGADGPDRTPFHGYLFRILTSQGPAGPGGARSYIINGKMTGGFAFIAFPAAYRQSGAKSFLTGPNGTVYERDLGPMTTMIAEAMKAFDPTTGWKVVPRETTTSAQK